MGPKKKTRGVDFCSFLGPKRTQKVSKFQSSKMAYVNKNGWGQNHSDILPQSQWHVVHSVISQRFQRKSLYTESKQTHKGSEIQVWQHGPVPPPPSKDRPWP